MYEAVSCSIIMSLTDAPRKGRKRTWREAPARTSVEEERERAHIARQTAVLPQEM